MAKKIIPPEWVRPEGMERAQPTFNQLVDYFAYGNDNGHSRTMIRGAGRGMRRAARTASYYFHYTKAYFKSLLELDWRLFHEFHKLYLREDRRTAEVAHSRLVKNFPILYRDLVQ